MKLALVYGGKSQAVANTIRQIKDNIEIDCFNDIAEFIDITLKRRAMYDRLLMPTTALHGNELDDLNQFWKTNMRNTSIVMLCRRGTDDELGNYFVRHFVSPNVCAMFVEQNKKTGSLLADAVLLPMDKLNETYGIKDFLNLQYEDEETEVTLQDNNSTVNVQEVNTSQQIQQNVVQNMQQQNVQMPLNQQQVPLNQQQMQINEPQQPKQKKGFSLFGRNKKSKGLVDNQQNVQQYQNNQTNTSMYNVPNMVQQNNGFENYQQGNTTQMQQPVVQQPYIPQEQQDTCFNVPKQEFTVEETHQMTTHSADFYNQPNVNEQSRYVYDSPKTNQDQTTPIDLNEEFEDLTENTNEVENINANNDFYNETMSPLQIEEQTIVEGSSVVQPITEPIEVEQLVDETDMDFGSISVVQEETVVGVVENDTLEEIEDDFDNIVCVNPVDTYEPTQTNTIEETVDEDLGSIDIASAENAYREVNETPKVITKEVVREVIRDTGGNSNIIKQIASGKNPQVIVVTGDRGTGITSTCLSIASYFSKTTPVLYFDCDVDNHGILNYISYEEFRDFEPTKQSGVKICKTSRVFNNCVCKFDTNFDVLSSDFSVEVEDKELECTAGVVAEKIVDYGLVVVDCPASKLHCISDLLLTGNTIICVDSSKRGFMNMLCSLEVSSLSLRYKKLIVNKGIMFLTKYNKDIDIKRIVNYVKSIYEPEGVDWLAIHSLPFNGRIDEKILTRVFTR